jgi:hypothetical protein
VGDGRKLDEFAAAIEHVEVLQVAVQRGVARRPGRGGQQHAAVLGARSLALLEVGQALRQRHRSQAGRHLRARGKQAGGRQMAH